MKFNSFFIIFHIIDEMMFLILHHFMTKEYTLSRQYM